MATSSKRPPDYYKSLAEETKAKIKKCKDEISDKPKTYQVVATSGDGWSPAKCRELIGPPRKPKFHQPEDNDRLKKCRDALAEHLKSKPDEPDKGTQISEKCREILSKKRPRCPDLPPRGGCYVGPPTTPKCRGLLAQMAQRPPPPPPENVAQPQTHLPNGARMDKTPPRYPDDQQNKDQDCDPPEPRADKSEAKDRHGHESPIPGGNRASHSENHDQNKNPSGAREGQDKKGKDKDADKPKKYAGRKTYGEEVIEENNRRCREWAKERAEVREARAEKPCRERCCCKCCAKFCKCFCRLFKPSLCYCWYCANWWLPFILILAIVLLVLELFYTFRAGGPGILGNMAVPPPAPKGLRKHSIWIMLMLIFALITSTFLISIIQITFFFILNEFKSKKSIVLWIILFALTLIFGIATIILSFICPVYCSIGEVIIDPDRPIPYVEMIRDFAMLKIVLLLLVMHIYIYYTYFYYQERMEFRDPDCEPGRFRTRQQDDQLWRLPADFKIGPMAGRQVYPEEVEDQNARHGRGPGRHSNRVDTGPDLRIKVFHVKFGR